MLWPSTRKPSTRELVRAEHRPLVARGGRLWQWAVFLVFCLIAALLLVRLDGGSADEQRLAALVEENHTLKAALEQRSLQQQEAKATEEQLLRRIAQLTAQVKHLQTDLAFFRQQKNNH